MLLLLPMLLIGGVCGLVTWLIVRAAHRAARRDMDRFADRIAGRHLIPPPARLLPDDPTADAAAEALDRMDGR